MSNIDNWTFLIWKNKCILNLINHELQSWSCFGTLQCFNTDPINYKLNET